MSRMNNEIEVQEKRSSFVFYEGFESSIGVLPKKYQLDAYKALIDYGLRGVEPVQLNGIVRAVFEAFRHQIDANRVRYENGKKGGRPRQENKPNRNQTETKQKPNAKQVKPNANVNANVNVNEKELEEKTEVFSCLSFLDRKLTLEQRKDLFWKELLEHVSTYGEPMITSFYSYWSETNASGKKLRLDGEKYFALKNRLVTWANRSK